MVPRGVIGGQGRGRCDRHSLLLFELMGTLVRALLKYGPHSELKGRFKYEQAGHELASEGVRRFFDLRPDPTVPGTEKSESPNLQPPVTLP